MNTSEQAKEARQKFIADLRKKFESEKAAEQKKINNYNRAMKGI